MSNKGDLRSFRQPLYFIPWSHILWKLRKLKHTLWWRLMPGTVIRVRWPVDDRSADPNKHYRPWLEAKVGKQCWDWNWDMTVSDMADNQLTIKFRKGKERQATEAALKWSGTLN